MDETMDLLEDDGPSSTTLSLTGTVASQIYVLSSSSISLTATFAKMPDGSEVLLPLADWQILGNDPTSEDEQEVVLERLLPLANIAFLLKDMTEEFHTAVQNLEALASGKVTLAHLDAERLKRWLAEVSQNATQAAACLDRLPD